LHFCLVKCMEEMSIRGAALRCSGSFITWITVCRFRPRIPLVLSFILVFCCFDLLIK
jgi:hypothetical protein